MWKVMSRPMLQSLRKPLVYPCFSLKGRFRVIIASAKRGRKPKLQDATIDEASPPDAANSLEESIVSRPGSAAAHATSPTAGMETAFAVMVTIFASLDET
jgi:hypothetical protein